MVIIGREILISALREWMARSGRSESVAVTIVAKFKTTLQMTAITILLWRSDEGPSDTWLLAGYVAMVDSGGFDAVVYVELLTGHAGQFGQKRNCLTVKTQRIHSDICGNSSAGRAQPCQG